MLQFAVASGRLPICWKIWITIDYNMYFSPVSYDIFNLMYFQSSDLLQPSEEIYSSSNFKHLAATTGWTVWENERQGTYCGGWWQMWLYGPLSEVRELYSYWAQLKQSPRFGTCSGNFMFFFMSLKSENKSPVTSHFLVITIRNKTLVLYKRVSFSWPILVKIEIS